MLQTIHSAIFPPPGGRSRMDPVRALAGALLAASMIAAPVTASAVGWDNDDFLVAGFSDGRIAVFDEDLAFKGYLDESFPSVSGLDFTSDGNLVAVARPDKVRVYQPDGTMTGSFVDSRVYDAIDAKIGPSDRLYTTTQTAGISEFSLDGTFLRTIGSSGYDGNAVLPGDVLWAGGDSSGAVIDVFDIASGTSSGTIVLDHGQINAESMFYSAATDTVLTTDIGPAALTVYERSTDGSFVRQFVSTSGDAFGVTRGPEDTVLATDCSNPRIVRWSADGTFLDSTNIAATSSCPANIVWAGNARPRIDEFRMYKGTTAKGAPKFAPVEVQFADRLESKLTVLLKPAMFATPASRDGGNVVDPARHLECYASKDAVTDPKQVKFVSPGPVTITNDFGFDVLELKKPSRVCVPTEISGSPSDLLIDHYRCYKAKTAKGGPKFEPRDAAMVDAFATTAGTVRKPAMLCTPADREGAGLLHEESELACYSIKDEQKFLGATVDASNVQGDESLALKKASLLCVPSRHWPAPACGDGAVNTVEEECDQDGSTCASQLCAGDCTCTVATCGDGVVNQPAEVCDGADDDACPGGCLGNCACPVCGNGAIEPPLEQCEPGDDSACPGNCTSCQCEGALRLVNGGNSAEGRLEVLHANQWGTVCDDGFDSVDATVACQQLGFSSGVAQCCATFGQGADPIWMDDLACTGSESRLIDCAFLGFGLHNCSHSEDVGVICTP